MKNIFLRPFGIVFWVHIAFVAGAAFSPFLLDWRIILAVFILLNVQWLLLGGCFLTFLETGWEKDNTFWHYYLSKIWPNLNKKRVRIIAECVLPVSLVLLTYVTQIRLGWQPLLDF